MSSEEDRFMQAVARWNDAHAGSNRSIIVRYLANHNGHCTGYLEATHVWGNPGSDTTWRLVCDHHLEDENFDPWAYPGADCLFHSYVRLWRQIELHRELMSDPEVIAAHADPFSPLAGPRLILAAVLHLMANHEFVGTSIISMHLTHEDVQRLCFGKLVPDFMIASLLVGIDPGFYEYEYDKRLVSPRVFGPITKIARIGNPPTHEGDK